MFQIHQHDANTNQRPFKVAFFRYGLVGDNETCQKFFFKAKILRSRQTGAKVKQTEFKKGF